MKKLWLTFLVFTISTLLFTACKKNIAEENYTEITNPVIPDFTTPVNAAVNGFVTDENGNAVEAATVKGGTFTVTTNQFGYFKISAAAFAKSAGFVQISKVGYFTGYRTFLPVEGKETFIRLQLISKTITGSVESGTGGTVTTADGAKIMLPANGVVIASSNAAYNGVVNVAVHWINPAEIQTTNLTMPGNLTGVDSAGNLNVLVTYGMLAVELSSNSGELLQMAAGKKAALSFPIPTSLQTAAPASIPLWYFDESKGVWKQEGRAVKNEKNYRGDVSHFTFWNCDIGLSLVNFSVQIIDSALNPISNVPVSISIEGETNSARIAYTNTNGTVAGMVPANSQLLLQIIAPCNQSITFKNIVSTNSDINLGSIKVNLAQYAATFKGVVNKCNGLPVTDGFVIIGERINSRIINIQNGQFEACGIVCTNTDATITAIDRETALQASVQTVSLVSGLNDFDILSACNSAPDEYFSYTLDGVTKTLTLPQHLFTGAYDFGSSFTDISAFDLLNGGGQVVRIYFAGNPETGDHPLTANYFFIPNGEYSFLTTPMVNISFYGLIGQFIDGTLSGPVKEFTNNNTHTFSCSFHIKRDN